MKKILCFLALAAALMLLAGCLSTNQTAEKQNKCLVFVEYGYLNAFEGTYALDGDNVRIVPNTAVKLADGTKVETLELKLSKEIGPLPFADYTVYGFGMNAEYFKGTYTTSSGTAVTVKLFKLGAQGNDYPALDGKYEYLISNSMESYIGFIAIKGNELVFDDGKMPPYQITKLTMPGKDNAYGFSTADENCFYYVFFDPATGTMLGYITDQSANVMYLMENIIVE